MLLKWAATSPKAVWSGFLCMGKLNCIEEKKWWRSSMQLIEDSCFSTPLSMPRDIRCYLLTVQQFSLSALPSSHSQQPSLLAVFVRWFTVSLYSTHTVSSCCNSVFNREDCCSLFAQLCILSTLLYTEEGIDVASWNSNSLCFFFFLFFAMVQIYSYYLHIDC